MIQRFRDVKHDLARSVVYILDLVAFEHYAVLNAMKSQLLLCIKCNGVC